MGELSEQTIAGNDATAMSADSAIQWRKMCRRRQDVG
jgi:hypothetical protein